MRLTERSLRSAGTFDKVSPMKYQVSGSPLRSVIWVDDLCGYVNNIKILRSQRRTVGVVKVMLSG